MKFFRTKTHPTAPSNGKAHVQTTACACRFYQLSEAGPTRDSNEDSILCIYPQAHFRTFFGMVADGMGGHEAGEVASSTACTAASVFVTEHSDDTDVASMLKNCMDSAQAAILQEAEENRVYNGMGTTATMIFIRESQMHFAHIGDSRLYHLRNKKLAQYSTDDTLVNQMLTEGKISRQEAEAHDMKHVLTQALGSVQVIRPYVSTKALPIEPGDLFFLCSDGIYDALQPAELETLLSMSSAMLAIECIKALCMQRKASDNFSAIVVEIIPEQHLQVPVTKEINSMV